MAHSKIKISFLTLFAIGMTGFSGEVLGRSVTELQEAKLLDHAKRQLQQVEYKSYFPYPVTMTTALRQQDKKPFLSALFPVMLELKDGDWKFMPTVEALSWLEEMAKDPLSGCPWKSRTLEAEIAYKPNLEFFLTRDDRHGFGQLTLTAEGQPWVGMLENGCATFCRPGDPAKLQTTANPKNIQVQIANLPAVLIPLIIPHKPFLLLRYQHGEILPAPARLDTVIFDPSKMRLYLGFRSTALMEAPLRKIEYRMTSDKDKTRQIAMETYLEECPKGPTGWAGEPCADPLRPVDREKLGFALGMRLKPASDAAGKIAGPAARTQF